MASALSTDEGLRERLANVDAGHVEREALLASIRQDLDAEAWLTCGNAS
jgi:hypothetical protein